MDYTFKPGLAGKTLGEKLGFRKKDIQKVSQDSQKNSLVNADMNQEYVIKSIETDNDEMKDFLFTLGCYAGETITVISILSEQYVVVVKDARYSIDKALASCIII